MKRNDPLNNDLHRPESGDSLGNLWTGGEMMLAGLDSWYWTGAGGSGNNSSSGMELRLRLSPGLLFCTLG